jgi:photosystem II stability/assembly factor-like uncharacterized protein
MIRATKLAPLLVAVFLSLAAAAAAAPHWVQATPFGGPVLALAEAPSSPQTLYAVAGFSGGLYASTDGAATWQFRPGLTQVEQFQELIVDPRDPRTVYGRDSGLALVRTRDGGRSWARIGQEELPNVFALLPISDSPGLLLAGTRSGLWRSADGGDSWQLAAFDGLAVLGLAADPGTGPGQPAGLLAAVGDSNGDFKIAIWASADNGATWAERSVIEPLDPAGALHFVFDPARPGTLYAFTGSSNVFRSTDAGASWAALPGTEPVRDLAAALDGTLYTANDGGVAQSRDGGETWSPPLPLLLGAAGGVPDDQITLVRVSAGAPDTVFAAGRAGVWKSADRGASWALASHGILELGVVSIAAAPDGPDAVYAVATNGLFRSTDQGRAWSRIGSDLYWEAPFSLQAFDPRDPRTIYGLGSDGQADFILKSTDGGLHWRRPPFPYSCGGDSICEVTLHGLALDPADPDVLYAAGSYFFHFQGFGNFLLRSDDFVTWKSLPPLPGLKALAVSPGRHGAIFGETCKYLLKQEAKGWRRLGKGLPGNLCGSDIPSPQTLVFDPRDPRRIYAGTGGKGVYVSADGGETFQPMNRGLEAARIATLLIDPGRPDRLYAAVAKQGVFRWNPGLRKWTPLNQGLPLLAFQGVLAVDPQDPSILYAGTASRGMFRLDLDGNP